MKNVKQKSEFSIPTHGHKFVFSWLKILSSFYQNFAPVFRTCVCIHGIKFIFIIFKTQKYNFNTTIWLTIFSMFISLQQDTVAN
jgi:hypothetical protein